MRSPHITLDRTSVCIYAHKHTSHHPNPTLPSPPAFHSPIRHAGYTKKPHTRKKKPPPTLYAASTTGLSTFSSPTNSYPWLTFLPVLPITLSTLSYVRLASAVSTTTVWVSSETVNFSMPVGC